MKRAWRWTLLGLLLVVATWGGLEFRSVTAPDQAVASAAPSVITTGALVVPPGSSSAPGLSAASAVGSPAPLAARGTESKAEDESLEVCGVGRMTRREAEGWSPAEMATMEGKAQVMDRRKEVAMSQLSARLAVGNDSSQVAARLLMGDWEGAAAVASRSGDAAAYRLALQGCGRAQSSQSAPSCRALSTAAWARLDPGDARPWILSAYEALGRRDEAAATQSIEQALQRRSRSPSQPLLRAVVSGLPGVEDRAALGLAVVEVIGVDAAMSDPGPTVILRYCSAASVRDGVRRDQCERLARWQFEHADSLMDASLAVAIADRVGMPPDQRPFTRQQLQQGQDRLIEQSTRRFGLDCASLEWIADWPVLLAQRNELQQALAGEVHR